MSGPSQGKPLNPRRNRLKQLRAFCFTARAGSISKAAGRLRQSQPSVSLQIKALEEELGAVLFERKGPRIALTPDGQVLLDIASPLVERMDNLALAFAERRGDVTEGELDIAAGESTILYLLPRFVQRFRAQYPRIRLRLHNVTGRDGLAQLRADAVDFAVGPMLEQPADICYHPIFEFQTALIAPKDHPLADSAKVSLEDISRYGLILPPRHLSTWSMVDLVFRQHGVSYDVKLEVGGWEVVKKYVELGLGISIVSGLCVAEDDRLASRSLHEYFPSRSYGVVLRRGRFISPAAKRFIRFMDPSFEASREAPC